MKKLYSLIFALSFIQTSHAVISYRDKLNHFLNSNLPNTAIGFIIQDPENASIIYESHSHDFFYPASNTKLLTAAAALKYFGPDFQYQTSIHTDLNRLQQGVLHDNLTFIFRGDPSFVSNDINTFITALKAKGIRQIKGNIIIDDTAFQYPPYAPGWTWDSIPWYYSAPITSIIINENKVRFKFTKVDKLKDKVKIEQQDTAIPKLKIQDEVIATTLAESEKNCQLNAIIKNNEIRLDGCWPLEKTPTFVEFALDNPRLIAKTLLLKFFQAQGITFLGEIKFEKAKTNIPLILIKKSPPLKNLIIKVLADSNNIYTESLTKALGIAYMGIGSFQAGVNAILSILTADSQIDFTQLHLSDGSGQSRYNLLTPFLTVQLLNHLYQDPFFPLYYGALSTSGQTGTLATRMKNPPLQGKVVAKTGSATGVSALSGFITGKSGKIYIFSLMVNQSDKDNYTLKYVEDQLCQLLFEEPWLAESS